MEKKYIGIKELAEYLGIPVGSLYVMCCYKQIPHYKIGRRTVFDVKEIEAWVREKRIKEII